mmetsp:Transcript_7581/g.22484  ORF Transcript_7581/g.22484 Transcript_7581/m.22484 type:complete len:186 (+) Transcript_7581:181-738(+)
MRYFPLLLVASTAALRLHSRRAFAVGVAVAPAAAATAAHAAPGDTFSTAMNVFTASDPTRSPFQGYYKDPEHMQGYRIVKADVPAGTLRVTGRDGPDDPEFSLDGVIVSQFTALIDFSAKGGPKNLPATFRLVQGRPVVEFPDGNGWARLSDKPVVPDPRDALRERPASEDKRSGLDKIRGSLPF